jgi:hypothetical protein
MFYRPSMGVFDPWGLGLPLYTLDTQPGAQRSCRGAAASGGPFEAMRTRREQQHR